MFHSLKYSVTFPSTGRTLKADLKLDAGFHAIIGSNETGKTMVLEMLRFGLFGSQALRGAADDYKTLKMESEFTIKGERYKVVRTSKKADLYRGDDQVASGVSTVNEKIVRLLGFGMQVFDMACSINQGEVEKLGSMTPTERKRMVDGVLGIEALDVVAKWGMEEARLQDKEAETLRRGLVAPVLPEQPADYVPSSEIDIATLRAESRELSEIEGFLQVSRSEPIKPHCKVDLPADNIRSMAQKRMALRKEVADLKVKIDSLPASVPYTMEQLTQATADWEAFDRYNEAQRFLQSHHIPCFSPEELWEIEDAWSRFHAYDEEQTVLKRIETLKAKGSKPCPHCGEDIPLEEDSITALSSTLKGLAPVAMPATSQAQVRSQRQVILDFDKAKHDEMMAVPLATKPAIERSKLTVYAAQLGQLEARKEAEGLYNTKAPQLASMPDFETMLIEREAYERALPAYQEQLLAYHKWLEEKNLKTLRKQALDGAHERLSSSEVKYAHSVTYEADLQRFSELYDAYLNTVSAAEAAENKAKEYRKVRDVMNVLRSLIKQHLLPSLNAVSSHLLEKMTGGQRRAIYVDENFDVIVDQQSLDTLSGSGKAVANLALRIALGQVLTNRVFSVLMADEIDASMDNFRAENTAEVLLTLQNSISQILQVSHKSIEATSYVDLGDTSEPTD